MKFCIKCQKSTAGKSTDHDKLTANKLTVNQRFRHRDFVIVFSSQNDGLGKMAPGIVKYFYDFIFLSQPIGVIWFAISCYGPIKYILPISFSYLTSQSTKR